MMLENSGLKTTDLTQWRTLAWRKLLIEKFFAKF
jgi:hypothetical protein